MRILTLLMCIASLALGAQEKEFEQLLKTYSVNASLFDSFCKGQLPEKSELNTSENFEISRLNNADSTNLEKMSAFFETFDVKIVTSGGFNFHIGDYFDGSRTVTCLDGPLAGLQAISVNGVKMAESTDVSFYDDGFSHWYLKGAVHTYRYKQVIEVY